MAELLKAQQEGRDLAHPDLLAPHVGTLDTSTPGYPFPGHAAWLDWPWKLHHIPAPESEGWSTELYNLADDPGETTNLVDVHPERAQSMLAALETWQRSVAESLGQKT
jgi:arylsulfatase A-like enzyme